MMQSRSVSFAVAFAIVASLVAVQAGCGGGNNHSGEANAGGITLPMLMEAFDAAGEPLAIALDWTKIDPDGLVEFSLVPEDDLFVERPTVEIDLFETEEAARQQAEMWRAQQDIGIHSNATIINHKNVVMAAFGRASDEKSERMRTILSQL